MSVPSGGWPPRRSFRARHARKLVACGAAALAAATAGASAQYGRVAVIGAATVDVPGAASLLGAAGAPPVQVETEVAGVPATLIRPSGDGPWPALVFVNGATAQGRAHPLVGRLARALAHTGFLVVVPEPPGLAAAEMSLRLRDDVVAVARAAAALPDALGGGVALAGVSSGAGLAIVAAADPALAPLVDVVLAVAPYADAEQVVRLGTTQSFALDGRITPYRTNPLVALSAARSVIASLEPGAERETLARLVRDTTRGAADPLAPLRAGASGAGPSPTHALLANREPHRFDALYARLPRDVYATIDGISPVRHAHRLHARVYVAAVEGDRYFPLEEAARLERANPEAVTLVASVGHGLPSRPDRAAVAVLRFARLVERALAHAEAAADARHEAIRRRTRARSARPSARAEAAP